MSNRKLVSGLDSRLKEALKDFYKMNTPGCWARIVITPNMVALYHGPIHGSGFEECATGSISYCPQKDGSVSRVLGGACG